MKVMRVLQVLEGFEVNIQILNVFIIDFALSMIF